MADEVQNPKKDMNWGNVAGGVATALQGAAGILDTSLQMAQAPDISMYQNQLDQMGAYRSGTTWDMNQLISDRAAITPVNATYEGIGGISNAGIAKGTLSALATGAAAGNAILPGWGALIGGVIGAGAGLVGGFTGRYKAEEGVAAIKARNKFEQEQNDLYFNTQADRIQNFQFNNLYANRAAQGGKIHIKKSNRGKFTEAAKRNHMTVQQFAKHVLSNSNKNKYSATMRKRANFARNAAGWKHAEGGQIETISDMEKFNTHGGYYAPDNLVRINTGGTHEQNPNGGVQYGMDQQGIPNLVEENENIYSAGGMMGGDYVFSDRIKATKAELKRFGLPEKYEGMSFSKIADKLSEEARQRPNDAVSANGMGAMLDRLQACQEDHKARLEQSRMRRELNNMSPEELMALGAQMAQQPTEVPQEQMPMQEAQPMVEAPMMQQAMPMEQAPLMAACGGPLRILGDGTPGKIVDVSRMLNSVEQLSPTAAEIIAKDLKEHHGYDGSPVLEEPIASSGLIGLIGGLGGLKEGVAVAKQASRLAKAARATEKGIKAREVVQAKKLATVTANTAAGKAAAAGKEAEKLISQIEKLNSKGKYTEAAALTEKANAAIETQRAERAAYRAALKGKPTSTTKAVTTAKQTASTTEAATNPTWWQRNKGWVIGTGIGGTVATGLVKGALSAWGGLGDASTEAVDAQVGSYSNEEGGRYSVPGYSHSKGGKLIRKYDWPGWLNEGPITAAIMTPPEYYDHYSYFTNNPLHTTGKVEWVRHPADASTTETIIATTPEEEVIFDGPLMADGTYARAQRARSGKGKASGKVTPTRQSYDALPTVKAPLGPGLIAADNKYGYILSSSPVKTAEAIAAAEDRRLRNTPNVPGHWSTDMIGPQYKKPEEWKKEIADEKAKEVATTTDSSALPTWMRYAGVLGNAALGIYNAFQEPDKLNLGSIKPVFINGRLALQRQRYNPLDQQSMVNPVLANTSAGYRAINDSGLGASTGAAMIAAMNAGNQGIGAATTQGRLYNDQLLSNVIQQNNAAEQAEANFYNRINTANAQIANNAILQNYYGNMRQQMYNNEAETAKWNAVSQALDASLTDLSNIGRENFVMNQVNSNTALLGYGVDKRGWNHYRTPDGYEVIVNPATEQIVDIKEESGTALSEARRKEIEAIVRQQIAAEKEPKYQLLKA